MASHFDTKVKGIAAYVHIDKPDRPKWDTQGKEYYNITVKVPKARAAEICKAIMAQHRAEFRAKAKTAHKPYIIDDDGMVSFKAKSQWRPAVYDIRGQEFPEDQPTMVGSGSLVIAAIRFKTYRTNSRQFGTTGYLQGVQVLKLRKYSAGANFGDASSEVDADDEEMFEAFEGVEEDEGERGEDDTPWDQEDDDDEDGELDATDF